MSPSALQNQVCATHNHCVIIRFAPQCSLAYLLSRQLSQHMEVLSYLVSDKRLPRLRAILIPAQMSPVPYRIKSVQHIITA